jgi:PhnB protein
MGSEHIRHGIGSARPYVHGGFDLIDLAKQALGAEELERADAGNGAHVELRIGDSVVVIEAGEYSDEDSVTRSSVYVYVPDVDAAYAKALELGATSIEAPSEKPYQERACGVRDSFGNIWYIATYRA